MTTPPDPEITARRARHQALADELEIFAQRLRDSGRDVSLDDKAQALGRAVKQGRF